jgi:hypothetical protein
MLIIFIIAGKSTASSTMEDHVDCWSRLETAASPDGAIFSMSVADDPDEFCIDISAIVTADEFA